MKESTISIQCEMIITIYAMLYTHAVVTILIIIAICIYLFLIYLEEEITIHQ
jgi:hypothetical protein